MGEPPSGQRPQLGAASQDRLDSWKEIAAYLRRDVSTVQRWEKREAMPVHRHVHDRLGSVYAFRSELDAWASGRNLRPNDDSDTEAPPDNGDPSGKEDLAGEIARSASASSQSNKAAEPVSLSGVAAWVFAAGGLLLVLALGAWRLRTMDYFWRDPLEGAQFQQVTDLGGAERAAAVSRDGKFVAFLSADRGGNTDVLVTQIGTGQFYNLTRGRVRELINPSVRLLGFSPDGTVVTFWARGVEGAAARNISVWAVPTLGGQPKPYLEGAAELDWSSEGSRIVYHTPEAGDPTWIQDAGQQRRQLIFAAAAGLHAHFPVWSPDGASIYFVQGSPPDAMDIWRLRVTGGTAERLTYHNSRVSHPVLLNNRTLLYLATDGDGSGPWLYGLDVERRVPHRVGAGLDRYTSFAASADGRRLVTTLANPKGTLWRLMLADTPVDASMATPISLSTGRGFSPRLGPGYLLYVSSKGTSHAVWKLVDGVATELWSTPEARVVGGPEISVDGQRIAFSTEQRGRTELHLMNADGTNARVLTDVLTLRGAPAWSPDGQGVTAAASVKGTPQLFQISLTGTSTPLVQEYSVDPAWSPDGTFLVYSGADVGTTFPVKAATANGGPFPFPRLTLTRGARRLRLLQGGRVLVLMRGNLQHKNLWSIDVKTGTERQLTNLPSDFDLRDFDISPDGREAVLERVQEQSDIVLIDRTLPK